MAKQLSSDEEANLKRQLRRRLIGAVALTTAAVIILPMVLDREPPPAAQDIELRIPDKEHAGEFNPQVAVSPDSAAVADAQPASAAAIAPLLDARPAPAGATPATKPQPVPQARAVTPPKPAAKPAEKSAGVPHSGFGVQVGAFANADSARHLKDQLAKQGYNAYTEKIGNKIRVRVGSYPSHDAADKVRRKLEAKGLHPNVVSLN
ncbi:MAG TPA: SPOR domain-containing protein [Gallionellaceae bacterium]|nr:SPOR domain-containing protein [Gallionellaceae bacterium]